MDWLINLWYRLTEVGLDIVCMLGMHKWRKLDFTDVNGIRWKICDRCCKTEVWW